MKTRTKKVITAIRCLNGLNILHDRAIGVKLATIDTWNRVEADGWLAYIQHVSTCAMCKAYEKQKRKNKQ